MRRLLQGDVGAGKTIVATYALVRAVESGGQGALMAPTEVLVDQHGAGMIAYISHEHSVNMAGGQPISMANMKAVYAVAQRYGSRVILDATRIAENAWFIQQREEGFGPAAPPHGWDPR